MKSTSITKKNIKTFLKGNKLNLKGKGLTQLPPAIFSLPEITILDLSDNRLKSIPARIGDLAKLKKLNLSNNLITTIDDNIAKLTKLEDLNLESNGLENGPSAALFELRELRKLNLTNCEDIDKIHFLPENITNLKKLKHFKLNYSRWGTRSNDSYSNYSQIEEVKGNTLNMSPLIIAETAFDQEDLSPVTYIFKHGDEQLIKKVLNHFYDAKKKFFDFKGVYIEVLPKEILSYDIVELNMTDTNFGRGSNELGKISRSEEIQKTNIIAQMKKLEVLVLDCDLFAIADLSILSSLRKLFIVGNYYITELFDFSSLQNLEELVLENMQLEKMPKGIFNLKKLKRLSIIKVFNTNKTQIKLDDFKRIKDFTNLDFFELQMTLHKARSRHEPFEDILPTGCESKSYFYYREPENYSCPIHTKKK